MEEEEEEEQKEGCIDFPIRGVKRSVSDPDEYPAERSTPRRYTQPCSPQFLPLFSASLFYEFPRDRRTERCSSRARLIARRIKGTANAMSSRSFLLRLPSPLSSVLIFVRHFESSTRKLLPEVDGTQKRIHLFHEIIS